MPVRGRRALVRALAVLYVLSRLTFVCCSRVCDSLAATTEMEILRPSLLGGPYAASQADFWSTAAAMSPACIVRPASTAEMVAVVAALLDSDERFAVKSGGHNPNTGFASVDGGPQISTAKLDQVVLDPVARTVRIGPGNRWDDVSKALDRTGFTVVGGRIGNVGVGGYMLGGGLSFMSTEHGWAANSVLAYELVLANATAVNVTAASHPDLFLALRGGGNAFGIVTSYLVRAHPQPDAVWGGQLVFAASRARDAQLLAAVRAFTQAYPDPKAGIIVTAERTLASLVDIWVVFLYYNGPSPPPSVFAAFRAAGPALLDTCRTRSVHELLTANNAYVVRGSVYTIGTETIPLPPAPAPAADGLAALQAAHAHWRATSGAYQGVPGLVASIAYQPMPGALAGLIAGAGGGDLYGMDAGVDRILVELDYSFWHGRDYGAGDAAMQQTYGGIARIVRARQDAGTLPADAYLPLFMNDAYFREDVFGRLRPDRRALAARVRHEVDPYGLWANRTGGFKMMT